MKKEEEKKQEYIFVVFTILEMMPWAIEYRLFYYFQNMANIKRTKDLKQLEKNKMTDMHALPK